MAVCGVGLKIACVLVMARFVNKSLFVYDALFIFSAKTFMAIWDVAFIEGCCTASAINAGHVKISLGC